METKLKENIINIEIFILAYIANQAIFKFYKESKYVLNSRFFLDSFHMLLYVIYGVFISDHYIKNQIDKVFNKKYL